MCDEKPSIVITAFGEVMVPLVGRAYPAGWLMIGALGGAFFGGLVEPRWTQRVAEAIVILLILCGGIGALLWWGSRLPPTRPRPKSRHRGETLMDVHQRLKKDRH